MTRPIEAGELAWAVRVRHKDGSFLAGRFYPNPFVTIPAVLGGYQTACFETRAEARRAAKAVKPWPGQKYPRASAVRVRVLVEIVEPTPEAP